MYVLTCDGTYDVMSEFPSKHFSGLPFFTLMVGKIVSAGCVNYGMVLMFA